MTDNENETPIVPTPQPTPEAEGADLQPYRPPTLDEAFRTHRQSTMLARRNGQPPLEFRTADLADWQQVFDFCDSNMHGDWFFRATHLHQVLCHLRHTPWIALSNERVVALAIIAQKTKRLINLLIDPEYRAHGLGAAIIHFLRPERIRVKVDMKQGDPTPFYISLGYRPTRFWNRRRTTTDLIRPDIPHKDALFPETPADTKRRRPPLTADD